MKITKWLLYSILFNFFVLYSQENAFYFCTVANKRYFSHLLNLIGSIHKHNFKQLGHIAVFDLGLDPEQIEILNSIEKLSINYLQPTNPDMLTVFNTTFEGKPVPGWYSWKPVAIKQAFDIFPPKVSFLFIDAGTTVLKNLSDLFESINHVGYFFHNGWNWPLNKSTTQFVTQAFSLTEIQNGTLLADTTFHLEAGLMGLSSQVYDSFISPVYELSKDIRYFADDGSSPGGFGYGRHDQTLYSIYAHLNKYTIHDHFKDHFEPFLLPLAAQQVPFHTASLTQWMTAKSAICATRHDLYKFKNHCAHIRYKNMSFVQSLLWNIKKNIFDMCDCSKAVYKMLIAKMTRFNSENIKRSQAIEDYQMQSLDMDPGSADLF